MILCYNLMFLWVQFSAFLMSDPVLKLWLVLNKTRKPTSGKHPVLGVKYPFCLLQTCLQMFWGRVKKILYRRQNSCLQYQFSVATNKPGNFSEVSSAHPVDSHLQMLKRRHELRSLAWYSTPYINILSDYHVLLTCSKWYVAYDTSRFEHLWFAKKQ